MRALDLVPEHTHYTRLQRLRGFMEPNIKSAFDEVFRRLDAMEVKWESKLEEVKSSCQDRDVEVDRRISALEDAGARLPAVPVDLERRVAALEGVCNASVNIPERISSLERYNIALSQSMVVADNWNHDLDARVGEVERRTDDLELIRLFEIRDERDDHVAALEDSVAAFVEWQPWIEAHVIDTRFNLRRVNYYWYPVDKEPPAARKVPCASSE